MCLLTYLHFKFNVSIVLILVRHLVPSDFKTMWCLIRNKSTHFLHTHSFCCTTGVYLSLCMYMSPALIRINTVCIYSIYVRRYLSSSHKIDTLISQIYPYLSEFSLQHNLLMVNFIDCTIAQT